MKTDGWSGVELSRPASGVLTVTLNHPERMNALSVAMKRDLIELFTEVQTDDETRVLVLTGAGRAFCAGDYLGRGYLTERPETVPYIQGGHADAESTYVALRLYSQGVNRALRSINKPTIAALNGVAIQSGLSLALACDFRLASTTARLGSATLRFGLMPDEGGHYLLLQHLGLAGTLDFLLRKRILDAADAQARGLVNEVLPSDELMPATLALASELAAGPQLAQRMLKRAVYKAAESDFEAALDDIAVRTAITDHHPDAAEGGRSFAEKRPPKFA
jgi:2-(1,2-epoxy-1,2-dihydrophenyl)acetyl-CoA isomerase